MKKKADNFPMMTSIRLPDGLKKNIEVLLLEINIKTGLHINRSEFICSSIEYYLRYLLDANSEDNLKTRLEEYLNKEKHSSRVRRS